MLNHICGNSVKLLTNKKCYPEKSKLNRNQTFMNYCGSEGTKRKEKFQIQRIYKEKHLILENDSSFL